MNKNLRKALDALKEYGYTDKEINTLDELEELLLSDVVTDAFEYGKDIEDYLEDWTNTGYLSVTSGNIDVFKKLDKYCDINYSEDNCVYYFIEGKGWQLDSIPLTDKMTQYANSFENTIRIYKDAYKWIERIKDIAKDLKTNVYLNFGNDDFTGTNSFLINESGEIKLYELKYTINLSNHYSLIIGLYWLTILFSSFDELDEIGMEYIVEGEVGEKLKKNDRSFKKSVLAMSQDERQEMETFKLIVDFNSKQLKMIENFKDEYYSNPDLYITSSSHYYKIKAKPYIENSFDFNEFKQLFDKTFLKREDVKEILINSEMYPLVELTKKQLYDRNYVSELLAINPEYLYALIGQIIEKNEINSEDIKIKDATENEVKYVIERLNDLIDFNVVDETKINYLLMNTLYASFIDFEKHVDDTNFLYNVLLRNPQMMKRIKYQVEDNDELLEWYTRVFKCANHFITEKNIIKYGLEIPDEDISKKCEECLTKFNHCLFGRDSL